MKYSVEFATGAKQDLFKIYRYIKAAGRPETARQFSEQIATVCSSLADNSGRGYVPAELDGLSDVLCRQLVFKNQRIIYQIIGHVVIIQGIIDGRRNISEVLRQRILI